MEGSKQVGWAVDQNQWFCVFHKLLAYLYLNHTVNRLALSIILSIFLLPNITFAASDIYIPTREEISSGDVEIIAGESRTIYEYRINGQLLMIKIVPEKGPAYYMIPTDGSAHYEDLSNEKRLSPSWVIFEW